MPVAAQQRGAIAWPYELPTVCSLLGVLRVKVLNLFMIRKPACVCKKDYNSFGDMRLDAVGGCLVAEEWQEVSALLHAPLPTLRSGMLAVSAAPAARRPRSAPQSAPAALGGGRGSTPGPPSKAAGAGLAALAGGRVSGSGCGGRGAGPVGAASAGMQPRSVTASGPGPGSEPGLGSGAAASAGMQPCSVMASVPGPGSGPGLGSGAAAAAARAAAGGAGGESARARDALAEHMERLLLEAVASGCASTAADIKALLDCTLARLQARWPAASDSIPPVTLMAELLR